MIVLLSLAGFLFFLFVVFCVVAATLRKSANSFQESMRSGKAEVVGYEREERSSWYTLLVKIPALHDDMTHNCHAGKIQIANYPKGTVVDVIYAEKQVMGIPVIEVHLKENPPVSTTAVSTVFRSVSLVCLLLALVFCAIAIIKYIV